MQTLLLLIAIAALAIGAAHLGAYVARWRYDHKRNQLEDLKREQLAQLEDLKREELAQLEDLKREELAQESEPDELEPTTN